MDEITWEDLYDLAVTGRLEEALAELDRLIAESPPR